jgi:hypothetical protein
VTCEKTSLHDVSIRVNVKQEATYHHAPDCEAPKYTDTNTAYEGIKGDMVRQTWYRKGPLANGKLFLRQ